MTRDKSGSSKVGEKKRKKETELFSAAYELFKIGRASCRERV